MHTDRRFQEELSCLDRIALQQTLFRLASATGKTLSVRYVMLSDGDDAPRLRAADMILGKLLPLRDNELERRLVDTEQVLRAIKENSDAQS